DPGAEGGDLFRRERRAFWGHAAGLVGALDALDQPALVGLTGDEGGALAPAAEHGGGGVETEARLLGEGAVATEAAVAQDGLDVAEVIDLGGPRPGGGREQAEREEAEAHEAGPGG